MPPSAPAFQSPSILHPSVMAAHAQTLQSGANAAASSASAVDVKVAKEVIPARIEFFENNLPHIFRNKSGHLLDTPESRKLLLDIANDEKNFLLVDQHGLKWYAKMLPDGTQAWASVKDNFIRNAGLNQIPKVPNEKTGLSRNLNL